MALFSLSHSSIGRTTHRPGTAGAHAAYVTRRTAASCILGAHMPTGYRSARVWLDWQEEADRKNARVIDRIMVALPRELDPEQQADLVREFVRQVGHGRIPWLAAIHAKGKDATNPHAHIILRDRDTATGKRVAMLSEQHSTDWLRAKWEECLNRALEAQGRPERVSRLSLIAQGIERPPQTHRGPDRERQSGIGRTYGFAGANPVRPPAQPSIRAAFTHASRQQFSPKPPAEAVSPRAAAKELTNRAAPMPEPETPPLPAPVPGRRQGKRGDQLPRARFLKAQTLATAGRVLTRHAPPFLPREKPRRCAAPPPRYSPTRRPKPAPNVAPVRPKLPANNWRCCFW